MKTTLLALTVVAAMPLAAQARTFNVATAADVPDRNVGDCACEMVGPDNLPQHPCSLRAAVQEANACPGADVIDLHGLSVSLSRAGRGEDLAVDGDLDVTEALTILGNGGVLDAAGLDRAFDVRPSGLTQVRLEVHELLVKNGDAAGGEGGALRVYGRAVLDSVDLEDNVANGGGAVAVRPGASLLITTHTADALMRNRDTGAACIGGGGIWNLGGHVVLENAVIESNSSLCGDGGAVRTESAACPHTPCPPDASVEEHRCNIDYNTARNGGALSQRGPGRLEIDGGQLIGNQATFDGGAVSATGTVIVAPAFFGSNHANGRGGAIAVSGGTLTILPTSAGFSINDASEGGAISITGTAHATIDESVFDGNHAKVRGGDLFIAAQATITGTVHDAPRADAYGGAIHVTAGGDATLGGVYIGSGRSAHGGALAIDGGQATLLDSTLFANVSTGGGGGAVVALGPAHLVIRRSGLVGNDAQAGPGGAISAGEHAVVELANVTLSGNQASTSGGGLHAGDSAGATLNNVTVAENTAGIRGGGIAVGGAAVLSLGNTVLARNSSPNLGLPDCSGTLTSTGYNLIERIGACTFLGANGDRHGVLSGLLPLAWVGTQLLHPLDPGSLARENGFNPTCAPVDQVGTPRPVGARCDIGAYEATP